MHWEGSSSVQLYRFYTVWFDVHSHDSWIVIFFFTDNRKTGSLQLDFQLPDRFKLEFSAEDEAKIERPVMIHRAILGSVERMFAILLEHYKGKWPFWLSPRQAILCPVSEKSQAYALQVQSSDFILLYICPIHIS